MKPFGMDKNRVLIYDGDIVHYDGKKWWTHYSELLDGLLLVPYVEGLDESMIGTLVWNYCAPGAVEVVNVSDKTNHERYFADLCSYYEMYYYICKGEICSNCIANGYLCTEDLTLHKWLKEPAVKL